MKRKILALALVLVIAAAAVVCVSCAKKEETPEKGKVSYTIVNNTGKNVTEIILSDTRSEEKVVATPAEGGLPDGESVGIEMDAMLEKNAPDVILDCTLEGVDKTGGHIIRKNGTITLLIRNGIPAK